MKTSSLPPLPWTWISLLAGALALIITAVIITGGKLEETKNHLANQLSERQRLLQRRFVPSEENLRAIKESIQVFNESLGQIQTHLNPADNPLRGVREKNAVNFKQELADEIRSLTQRAIRENVTLPADFSFGFARYIGTINPPDRATVTLGKQLLAIRELSRILIQSGVAGITRIRRVQDPAEAGLAPSRNADELLGGEPVPVIIKSGTQDIELYRAYPLEFTVDTTTTALRQFIKAVQESPYIFVIRSLNVLNKELTAPKLDQLAQAAEALQQQAESSTKTSTGEESSDSPAPTRYTEATPIFALGDELLTVTLRIDMIEWIGAPEKNATASASP